VFAQVDTSSISQTKKYVTYLDSINNLNHLQEKGFVTTIADGIIKTDGEIVGGFSIYTLSNYKADTAFRIEYHDNLNININKTYYFKFNKLIFAKLELQDGRANMKSIYLKEEFYNNDNIVWTTTKKEKSAGKYFDKTNFILYQDGLSFLADFKKDNNRR
jgi:hypothetical protein